MQPIKEYPKQVQRNLDLIEDAFYDSDKHMQSEVRLLVAALRSFGFGVTRAMAGYPDISWSRSGTPCVDIESPLVPYTLQQHAPLPKDWDTRPGYRTLRRKLHKAKLEAKIELMKLIEEFYYDRYAPFNTRLTFNLATGMVSFRLHCQGAKEAASFTEPGYIEWLQSAQAEMQAFAEFLCSKVKA